MLKQRCKIEATKTGRLHISKIAVLISNFDLGVKQIFFCMVCISSFTKDASLEYLWNSHKKKSFECPYAHEGMKTKKIFKFKGKEN